MARNGSLAAAVAWGTRGVRKLTIASVAFPFALVTSDPVGGAEQVLARIDRALSAAGHRSIVIATEGSDISGELISIPRCCRRIGTSEWARVHEFLRVAIDRLVTEQNVDIVHMHGVDYQHYLPVSGIRVLATLHLPLNYYPPGTLDPIRPQTWLNSVSKYQHESAGPHPRLACVIENGVEAPACAPTRKQAFALAMGRICPEKGFHLALDAAKAANVPLKLAGAISGFAEHQEYFEKEIRPRLDHRRQWIGVVSGKRKWRLLLSASCVVVPSLVAETASLVAREALAAGTPVVAYPNGALAETVENGRTGFLVNTVEEMSEALLRVDEIDPSTCRQVAQERYSATRMTDQYLELYDRLLQVTQ
jgi:glycosyltransferase involved in cell wall biosynthesis